MESLIVITISFLLLMLNKSFQSNNCVGKDTCKDCIRHPNCSWCSQNSFLGPRCGTLKTLITLGCQNSSIENPETQFKILLDEKLTLTKVAEESEAIQIRPQRVLLKLRPKNSYIFTVKYRQTVDYPVDCYYLMDLSRTMSRHKEILASLANELARQMKLITKNVRLGFGSFVDKKTLPFANTHPKKLVKPCLDCAPLYLFRHHMSLNNNISRFSNEVRKSQISGNLDGPEGGLDAIMQAIVCTKEIGWRNNARHLLIFASDAVSHYAGDGKLAGIFKPNDEECHLDSHGYYINGNDQDYPSVNQINMVSQKNNVHIIFAISSQWKSFYQKLSKRIKSSSSAILSSDSSNIVQIIKNEYQKLTSSVQLADNSSSNIKISYYSSCLQKNQLKETNICHGLQVDSEVEFKIKLEVLSCPKDKKDWKEIISIHPLTLNETLIVELNIICDCECSSNFSVNENHEFCKNRGIFRCGMCSCNLGFYGKNCECSNKESSLVKNEYRCYRSNSDTKPCSGRGSCICGQCSCHQLRGHKYTGEFCECDDNSCQLHDGKICGGVDRGICKCGKCECNDKWTGPSCECTQSTETCFDSFTSSICNNRGTCECGICKCSDPMYTGIYCDECPTCPGQCPILKPYIIKQIDDQIPVIENSENYSSHLESELILEKGEKACTVVGDKECIYKFNYRYTHNKNMSFIIVRAEKTKKCQEPIDVKLQIVRYSLSILVIGIITLIVSRLVTYIIDEHEYQKFKNYCRDEKWETEENPLFKPSTSTFNNPSYIN